MAHTPHAPHPTEVDDFPARQQLHGACGRTADRAAWLEQRETAAKAVCGHCTVRVECRRYALTTREPYGVWGGLTEIERHRLLADGLRRPESVHRG
ncbi:WhiB family transcriptional regulator [Kitasatospora sp. MMS16-BH015]|uniref:WhiB family transcriptional regulator n=1 Tax=Kitasatospora sp. MMS16-BH015 TaxID=2018025 RepID=UPI000CA1826C|nr:WhiB family transcriptional regulator [Kitasatospora sp. MMS16-BH015]AUG80455.1 WhiB family transcriptional regulator [Kitasatospora sp. MMS16-BH015]